MTYIFQPILCNKVIDLFPMGSSEFLIISISNIKPILIIIENFCRLQVNIEYPETRVMVSKRGKRWCNKNGSHRSFDRFQMRVDHLNLVFMCVSEELPSYSPFESVY